MAANRLGFSELFGPLYREDRLKTGLLDGTLPGLRLFSEQVLPLVKARQRGDEFGVAAILRKRSDLLSKQSLVAEGADQTDLLKRASEAVDSLIALWNEGGEPSFHDMLYVVAETNLFPIPDALRPYAHREEADFQQEVSALLADVEIDGS